MINLSTNTVISFGNYVIMPEYYIFETKYLKYDFYVLQLNKNSS